MSQRKTVVSIYIPNLYVMKIKVGANSKIGELRNMLAQPNLSFVLNGQILSNTKTFKYYKIKQSDSLVAVKNNESSEIQRWLSITKESDVFREKISMVTSEDTAHEIARVRDVILTKIERKPRYFRRLCQNYNNIYENGNIGNTFYCYSPTQNQNKGTPNLRYDENNNKLPIGIIDSFQLKTDYEPLTEPSVAPLPITYRADDFVFHKKKKKSYNKDKNDLENEFTGANHIYGYNILKVERKSIKSTNNVRNIVVVDEDIELNTSGRELSQNQVDEKQGQTETPATSPLSPKIEEKEKIE